MAGNQQSDRSDIFSWVIVILALTFAWPLGLFLLFWKLNGSRKQNRRKQGRSWSQPGMQGVRTGDTDYRSWEDQRGRDPQKNKLLGKPGKGLVIGGSVMAGLFGLSCISEVFDAISSLAYGGSMLYYLQDIFMLLGLTGVGGVLLGTGLRRNRRAQRFRKYLALIGSKTDVQVEPLARAMPVKFDTACDDLQEMLDKGLLPPWGYLDMSTGRLRLASDGLDEEPEPQPEVKPEDMGEDDRILAQIRAVNDAIADEEMSDKIDRIEDITRRIFLYQKQNPEKGNELRTFLNYYLPTTLKLLNSYAQMEEQHVEGVNINASKESIEGMMDKVVEGFEKQLDKLFEGTAMDITTDVQVLERMLEKDGLSQQDGLTLGGH